MVLSRESERPPLALIVFFFFWNQKARSLNILCRYIKVEGNNIMKPRRWFVYLLFVCLLSLFREAMIGVGRRLDLGNQYMTSYWPCLPCSNHFKTKY